MANQDQLHTHAIQAEKHLEQLATGLGQVGAEEAAVKAVGEMAEAIRGVIKTLGRGGTMQGEPDKPRPTMDSAADEMMAERRTAESN